MAGVFTENELAVMVDDGNRSETVIRTPARFAAFNPFARSGEAVKQDALLGVVLGEPRQRRPRCWASTLSRFSPSGTRT
jgi:hypothetical protein